MHPCWFHAPKHWRNTVQDGKVSRKLQNKEKRHFPCMKPRTTWKNCAHASQNTTAETCTSSCHLPNMLTPTKRVVQLCAAFVSVQTQQRTKLIPVIITCEIGANLETYYQQVFVSSFCWPRQELDMRDTNSKKMNSNLGWTMQEDRADWKEFHGKGTDATSWPSLSSRKAKNTRAHL